MPREALLHAEGIEKRFGPVRALQGVGVECRAGEILALLGENGAGKSTLMEIVGGAIAPDAGRILWKGEERRWRSPADARRAGIAIVHQHFMLVPTASAAENFALARGYLGRLSRRRLGETVTTLARSLGLEIPDPHRPVEQLSVGEQQRVEILKALDPPPDLLVLDEPTAVLTPEESEGLMELLRSLAARGTGIILITHKLKEALSVADRVVVLRRGNEVARGDAADENEASLALAMVGRTPEAAPQPPRSDPGPCELAIRGLSLLGEGGRRILSDISFDVSAGEVVAIAGAWGNGQEELFASLAGSPPGQQQGEVRLGNVLLENPAAARAAGLAIVPADRRKEGLVAGLALEENLLLDIDELQAALRGWQIDAPRLRERAEARLAEFDVRPADPLADAGALSGGNQQRLILSRELGRRHLRAIIAANPTRGLDFDAARQVQERLLSAAANGAAVLVFSADLDEVEALASRVAVLYDGRLRFASAVDRTEIGRLLAGVEGGS